MMLNSYLPNAFRRYAIAGLAIASITPLAAFAGDLLAGVGGGFETMTSPLGLAAIAAPVSVTGLVAGLGAPSRSAGETLQEAAETRPGV